MSQLGFPPDRQITTSVSDYYLRQITVGLLPQSDYLLPQSDYCQITSQMSTPVSDRQILYEKGFKLKPFWQ